MLKVFYITKAERAKAEQDITSVKIGHVPGHVRALTLSIYLYKSHEYRFKHARVCSFVIILD